MKQQPKLVPDAGLVPMEQDQEGHVEPATCEPISGVPKTAEMTGKEKTKMIEMKAYLKSHGMCTKEVEQRLAAAEPKRSEGYVLAKTTQMGLQKHMQRIDRLAAQTKNLAVLVEEEAKAHAKIKTMLEKLTSEHEAKMEEMRSQGQTYIQTAVTKLQVAKEEHAVEKSLCEEEEKRWASITKDTDAEEKSHTNAKLQATSPGVTGQAERKEAEPNAVLDSILGLEETHLEGALQILLMRIAKTKEAQRPGSSGDNETRLQEESLAKQQAKEAEEAEVKEKTAQAERARKLSEDEGIDMDAPADKKAKTQDM
jgi:hypothetical protein